MPLLKTDRRCWRRPTDASGEIRSEPEGQTTHDALGWADNEELVVNGRFIGDFAEQVPHADEHFPVGAGEVHERERLRHLHVEARAEFGTEVLERVTRVRIAQTIQGKHVRLGDRDFRVDRGGIDPRAAVEQILPAARTGEMRRYDEVVISRSSTQRVEKKRDWAKTAMIIGGSAGAGAGIGGIAKGKQGALIGAAIGGGTAAIIEAIRR